MLHDLVHALSPLMWAGIAITFLLLRHRRRMAEIDQGMPRRGHAPMPAPAPDNRQEIEDLRERVRVLERIATASSLESRSPSHLAAEIEALRGQ